MLGDLGQFLKDNSDIASVYACYMQTLALKAMGETAKSMSVLGAAGALVLVKKDPCIIQPSMTYFGRFFREADPLKGESDTGANYLSVAFAKMAQSIRTLKNSGTKNPDEVMKGEVPYMGCVVHDSTEFLFFCAFSGGTEEQDVQIATAGLEAMIKGYKL